MARRGRCRCGFVLEFHRGEQGYKTRCPECGAVVRLRSRSRKKVRLRTATCACGYAVLLAFDNPSATCPSCKRTVTSSTKTQKRKEKKAKARKSSLDKPLAQRAQAPVPIAQPFAAPDSSQAAVNGQAARAAACELCSTIVPAQAERCPGCGAPTLWQSLAPSSVRNSGPRTGAHVPRPNSRLKKVLVWLFALGGFLAVAGIILLLMIRR